MGAGTSSAQRLHIFGSSGTTMQIDRSASSAGAVFKIYSAATTDPAFQASVTGDSSSRLSLHCDGKIGFGDGTGRDIDITRPSTAQLRITPAANASTSTSTGGALNLTNTGSTGAGLVVYSAQSAPSGHLMVVRANHATFNQTGLYVDYLGTSHGISVNHQGTGGASSALNLASSNTSFSTMQVSGVETTTGTLKLTHTGTGSDSGAAAVSLNLAGAGTASQGIYLTGATTGDLIKLVNNATIQFSVSSAGNTLIKGTLDHDGSNVGFYGTSPISKPTVSGSRGGNAALASLITALANLGLITDSSSA